VIKRVLLAAGLATLAAACSTDGGADRITYKDPDQLSVFSIPSEWHLYELSELSALADLPFSESFQGLEFPTVSHVAFDGSPARDVTNVITPMAQASYPIGSVSVRSVGPDARDYLSRVVLHQTVLPYYTYNQPDEVAKEDFSFGAGFDGIRVLVTYVDQNNQDVAVAYLISVHDAAEQRIFSIVAGCNLTCFTTNQATIEEVVDSWLVNTKA